ncbi:hypothetical protein [Gordonia soli]|uniref:Uncharacterized protein n=1 Tax=Gordonia soli NBRC 108243 TaxID=1223545 RepID=M0QP71_9ACTN|nr:hypothetical protein [Gordonia soli]GAC70209.1 hypothetical protein GS4_33_00230 [Gordonia soli NBRC 108243]
MTFRSRLANLTLAVLVLAISVSLATSSPASAAPTTQTKLFDILGQTYSLCPIKSPGREGNCVTRWYSATNPEWTTERGERPGTGFQFSKDRSAKIRVSRTSRDGTTVSIEGTIPDRESTEFTITEFSDPRFGTVAPGQKLNLVITAERNPFVSETLTAIRLSGNLSVTDTPSGGNALAGLLGSS